MDIIPYAQLEDKRRMLPLFYHAGHSPFDYRRRGNGDFRIRKGYEGLCGVEDGELLGFVGFMDIPTRTVSGTEVVGGIWGVVTDSNHVRKGVSKALMEASHQYFQERGFRFSFLTTYGSWGAHRLYRKLGYEDVKSTTGCPIAYRLMESDAKATGYCGEFQTPTEEGVAGLFEQFTSQLTGFVIRPKEYLSYVACCGGISLEHSLEVEGGYVLANERMGLVQAREVVAMNSTAQGRLLDALEQSAAGGSVLDSLVTTTALRDGYAARGYQLYSGRYGVLMAKELGDASMDDVYGDRFYISAMEWF
jgi:GNAT superfamily N-acetyltransferase